MSDETTERKPGKLRLGGKLGSKPEAKKTVSVGKVQQSFSRGRSKTVTVEVKRPRAGSGDRSGGGGQAGAQSDIEREKRLRAIQALKSGESAVAAPPPVPPRPVRAAPVVKPVEAAPVVEEAPAVEAEAVDADAAAPTVEATPTPEVEATPEAEALPPAPEPEPEPEPELSQEEREMLALKQAEAVEREKIDAARREAEARAEAAAPRRRPETERARPGAARGAPAGRPAPGGGAGRRPPSPADAPSMPDPSAPPSRGRDDDRRKTRNVDEERRAQPKRGGERGGRRTGKLTITQVVDGEVQQERTRSLASIRRVREKEKQRRRDSGKGEATFVVREVRVPEVILVSELANRMAVRTVDVVKKLMTLGIMATPSQSIDSDTAELVIEEFGHKIRRVSESDVEIGMDVKVESDAEEDLLPRPPVVTVMGHVDHGKTSLLDALRKANVVSGEAGGITQHIGAYQVQTEAGEKVTFLDTPGHAAFSAMRQRGAKLTDLVILVVAADDTVQPQTIEAINHARAANAPMIVALNKCDRPESDPDRIKQELLSQEVVSEDFGGDIQMINVSATQGTGLDELVEAISLQAELLELTANPNREARGGVVEAQLDRGRGPVATILVQSGTLKRGDVLVAGAEWGRVRAMIDEHGDQVQEAGPSMPVSVLGLSGVPLAGDEVVVVPDESRAREVSEYRQRVDRDKRTAVAPRGTIEDMFGKIAAGVSQELPIIVKCDVQGSLEAIVAAIEKLANDEVSAKVIHAGVGAINESDVTLAASAGGFIVGFNVRASGQARAQSQRDGVDIRYYSIIYELLDDLKSAVEGLLAPEQREKFIGNAEVREVFNITKVGKIAGCRITDGIVRRGAGVRLLRDNVVIHQGKLATLKRFKEEVREVRDGFECGMAFENYHDIQTGDVIECYEIEEVARTL